jgi:hypothetical protein
VIDYEALAQRFRDAETLAGALMGSRARGDAGPFSDVDLVFLVREERKDGSDFESYLVDGKLVNVSRVADHTAQEWFSKPIVASEVIGGLRDAKILFDPQGLFAEIQQRALAFEWDQTMRERASDWVSCQMVGWAEEVGKGLEGLRRGDPARLLQARHGLSWGLNHVVQLHLGVLLTGDNGFFEEVGNAVGKNSRWVQLRNRAFGVGPQPVDDADPLAAQVIAGLELYVETAQMVAKAVRPDHRGLVAHTVEAIRSTQGLGGANKGSRGP